MHSIFLNHLGIYMVVFSIPKLLDPRTRPQVGEDSVRILPHTLGDI